jgi:tetratricopeptide (TPR) repeat protein
MHNVHNRSTKWAVRVERCEADSVTAEPTGAETLQQTVASLLKRKHYDEALHAVAAFLAEPHHSDAETTQAFVEQGHIYFKMKRLRQSLAAFERAIEVDDQCGAAWVGRAVALYELDRDRESLAAYRRARDLAPQDARSLNGMGMVLLTFRQFASALIALDRAQELDPLDFDIAQNRLVALRKLHHYRQFLHEWFAAALRIGRSQQP